MKKPLVSIIVLNFNGKKLLESFFESILGQKYKEIEIILVDNGSKDDSLLFVKNNFPQVIIVANSTNHGFSEAGNQGAKKAKGKYLFFLNNDAQIEKNSLEKMVSFLENKKDVILLGPFVYKKDGITLESAGLYPTFLGIFYNPFSSKKKPFETFAITGAAMLIKRAWFEKINGFDKDFFAYSEDIDLCIRTRILGGKIYVLPECKVLHLHAQTSKKMDRSFIVFHATKNRILLLLKNFSFLLLSVILPIHLVLLLLLTLLFIFSFKIKEARAVLKGIFWNIKNLSSTLDKRKKVFRLRKVSEWQLVRKYFRIFPKEILFAVPKYIKFW